MIIEIKGRLLGFCLIALMMMLGMYFAKSDAFKLTDISGVDWGQNFSLTDHNGQNRKLVHFRDKVVVLFFGYTQCPDVCPTMMQTMNATLKLLGDDAKRVQVLFVTLDPARDTQAVLAEYVTQFNHSFLGLYADEGSTETTAKDFHAFYTKVPGRTPTSYTIDHSTSAYVYDPHGQLRLLFKYGETPANLASDIKILLHPRHRSLRHTLRLFRH